VIAGFLFLGGIAFGEVSDLKAERDDWTFSFYFENDLFANTDRNYTNGTKLTWISPDVDTYFREAGKLPGWAYDALRYLPLVNKEGTQKNVALSFGQNLYTPSDISQTGLIVNDRPYAAWLYFGVALHNKTDRWLDTIEVNVGVIGPWALGEETQNFIHRTRGIRQVYGWDNQIGNEIAVNIIWERKFRWVLFGDGSGMGMDALAHMGASVGNVFTYANSGGGLRLGWNLPQDFGAALIRMAGDTNAPASLDDLRLKEDRVFGIHIFGSLDGRAIARDATLDGNTFASSHSVDKESLVGDASVGVSTVIGRWKVSYAWTYRTKTFKEGLDQAFGSINVSMTF